MKYLWVIILLVITVGSLLVLLSYEKFSPMEIPPTIVPYKGICLFDIDGTLTTGRDNARSVDICLQAGYAVGISTAGPGYNTENLHKFEWMPDNLYSFMRDRNFDTFNNVGSSVLGGVYNPQAYKDIKDRFGGQNIVWGLMKGRSLEDTARRYHIKDPEKMVLFDNDPVFLEGMGMYNPNFRLVCAGAPCGDTMSPKTVIDALNI